MLPTPRQQVEKQIRRVCRRLILRRMLDAVVVFWAGALVLSAIWFLARPFVTDSRSEWTTWWMPSAIVAGATIAALLWAYLRRPPLVEASLALDREFDLKERITTYFLLSTRQAETPVGEALLGDVKERIGGLDFSGRFPVRVRWTRALLPIGAGLLALAASFFDPSFGSARTRSGNKVQNVVDAKEVQEQIDLLRKASTKDKDDELKSDKLKELEAEWEKLAQKPLDPTSEEKVRERANELRNLEEKLKDRLEKLKSKADSKEIKKQLEKLGLDKLSKKAKDGPAKDFEDALSKGKLDKAREALEKLQKDLAENKLGERELKQLAEQMQEMRDKLQRLAENQDDKDRLQKEFEDGKIDRDQLDRELDRMAQEAAEMQDLQELADLMGECMDCLGRGMNDKAGARIRALMGRLKEIEMSKEEFDKLKNDLELLEAARCRMLGACRGNANALGEGGVGGKRPIGKDPETNPKPEPQQGDVDPTSQQRVTGFVKGGSFRKIPAKEVAGAFKQTAQETYEALDRQRIPPEYTDITKGYFKQLSGQK